MIEITIKITETQGHIEMAIRNDINTNAAATMAERAQGEFIIRSITGAMTIQAKLQNSALSIAGDDNMEIAKSKSLNEFAGKTGRN